MKPFIIGSRESELAVAQTKIVTDYLNTHHPEIQTVISTMKTTGDIILDRRLDEIGGKGLFVKELDMALLEGRTDLSVHSLKDMPMEIPEELPVVAFSKREDPRDVLILPKGGSCGEKTGDGIDFSKPIGTSSKRRILQLKSLYPEARFESVRGNIRTRLRKLDDGLYGALVLSAAGILRLGLKERISRYYSVDEIIPSAGQGILAVQGRKGENYGFLEDFSDSSAGMAAAAERGFTAALGGGCTQPVAAYAYTEGDMLVLQGFFYDEDREKAYRKKLTAKVLSAQEARMSGERLAGEVLREIREQV